MPNDNTIPEREKLAFVSSDAWVLLSIAMGDSGGGASLRDIIAAGDYINHAILITQELQGGLSRLSQAKYIHETSGRFSIAGAAQEFWTDLGRKHKRRAVLRLWEDFEEFLKITPGPVVAETTQQTYPGVNDETVEAAYQEYWRGYQGEK